MRARHHLVPQFYLRGFADASGQVRLVARDDFSRTHDSALRKAVAEVGYYRIETEDLERPEDRADHDPEAVEAGLAQLEDAIAPVIAAIVAAREFRFADETELRNAWYRMIQFTSLQSVRGTRWRADYEALVNHSARMHVLSRADDARLRDSPVEQGRPHAPTDVADFRRELFEGPFPRVLLPKSMLVQQSLKMALGDPQSNDVGLAKYLATKRPSLIRTCDVRVLTADEPVCWWSPGSAPVGFANALVVWVPLSRDLILQFIDPNHDVRDFGLPDARSNQGADELASNINDLVAGQAERWIVHHPADAPLAGIDTMSRTGWGDELVAVEEANGVVREVYVHRRL